MTINIKEAVKSAQDQALQLFEAGLENLALEEVEFDETSNAWLVTLGYDSPHKMIRKINGPSLFPTIEEEVRREYKIFRIDSNDGHLISMSIRSL